MYWALNISVGRLNILIYTILHHVHVAEIVQGGPNFSKCLVPLNKIKLQKKYFVAECLWLITLNGDSLSVGSLCRCRVFMANHIKRGLSLCGVIMSLRMHGKQGVGACV